MTVTIDYNLNTVRSQFVANGWVNGDQYGSEVIGLSNGGFAVTYGTETYGAVGIGNYPMVTFYDSDFVEVSPFSVPYFASRVDMIGSPEIVELANGTVAVIWKEGANSANKVFGTIFDPNTGSKLVIEFEISGIANHNDPEATALPNGNWIVAMTNNSIIYMQQMDSAGNKVGGLVDTGLDDDYDPAITALDDGGWVLTYTEEGTTSPALIWGKIYNADGSVRTADYIIGQFGDNIQSEVAALNNGNWAVVYTDSGWSGDGITLQIFSPTGVNLTPGTYVRVDTDINAIEQDPDITVLDNGFIVVSWTDPAGAGDILGRVFDENGNVVAIGGSTDPFVITNTATEDTDASISTIVSGLFINTWSDTNSDGNSDSISGEINEIYSIISSDNASDLMQGDALRNTFIGLGGNDTMFGGAGNDSLNGDNGLDIMRGGGGDDTMFGGSGQDDMQGQTGDDIMEGGSAADTMNGGSGNDEMYGQSGNDQMSGSSGMDIMYGGAGNDKIGGQSGNDELYGNYGKDNLNGGTGNDNLFGGLGNDRLFGREGNDFLYGGADDDFMKGGSGNDFLQGGAGNDIIRGESGLDIFQFNDGSGTDRVADFEDDIDTIELDETIWGGGLTIAQVLATFGTQISAKKYELDFGGDVLEIISSNPFNAGDLLNDIAII